MEENQNSDDQPFFEEVVKKTKTGITFPKDLRESLFEEDTEVYFRMIVPKEKDKIILELLSDEQVKEVSEKLKAKKPKVTRAPQGPGGKKIITGKKATGPSPAWGEYFV
ncbi:MAG: hypothetical protein KAT57_04975, partial [Candidatus Lokiarchaeota archaeon]|nr:hypothetical protein [Candidatus Lokiarchaeota archaeon]